MSEKEELKEKIIVYKNYANVLKKKNTINKDSMERNQKLILKLQEENKRQQKEIEKLNKENKELKNRIGRAIYFFGKKKAEQGDIYRNCESYKTNCIDFILTDNEIKLLNILKGSDKG